MKKILLTVLYLIVSCVPLISAERSEESKEIITIEIIVVDAITEEPIPAAKIIFDKQETEAYTDFDGFAKINEVSQGLHDIEISFVSYQKQHIKAISLDQSNTRLLVKLQP